MRALILSILVLSSLAAAGQAAKSSATPIQIVQPQPEAKINWLSFEEAYALWQKDPGKKFVIDVFTDWCGWCKVMDKNTFTNPVVADFINKYYYPVKFNAEQRKDIMLGTQKYSFIAQGDGGVHSLAAALLSNQLSYPTTVFLDEHMRMIQPVPGYMDAPAFHQLTSYFFTNFHKVEPFDKYKAETYVKLYGEPVKVAPQSGN
jgi:thioredoxin-related protein